METSILFLQIIFLDMYETIPDNEFNHHRGATSYHPKMITSCTLSNT